jgi:hypothetical protein
MGLWTGRNAARWIAILNTPAPPARFLRGHEVSRTRKLGWHRLVNGALLDAAERAGFEVLVTCDQSVPYQQNFEGRKLSVVILTSNRWPILRPVAPRIATAIDFAQRGQVVRIDVAAL